MLRLEGHLGIGDLLRPGMAGGQESDARIIPPSGGQVPRAASLPTLLVACFGLRADTIKDFFALVDLAQKSTAGFRVIIYTDSDLMSLARPYGWAVEHHMDEFLWREFGVGQSWERSVLEYGRILIRTYGVSAVVTPDVGQEDFGLISQLRRVLPPEIQVALSALRKFSFLYDESERIGWRGWLHGLQPGAEHRVTVHCGRGEHDVVIVRGSQRAMLGFVVDDVEGAAASRLWQQGTAEGWSMFAIQGLADPLGVSVRMGISALYSAFGKGALFVLAGVDASLDIEEVDYVVADWLGDKPVVVDLHDLGYEALNGSLAWSWDAINTHRLVREASLAR